MNSNGYSPQSFTVTVYSYNILTTQFQTDRIFKKCQSQMLKNRKNWIANVLEEKLGDRKTVIFCLQEVSADLGEHLKSVFETHACTMISTSTHNGYLGEAIAFSSDLFEVSNMKKHEFDKTKNSMRSSRCKRPYFLFLKLQHKQIPCTFCIGSVHLPLKYRNPVVQLIHTGNVVRHFERFRDKDEGILAGDFNMNPSTVAYNAVTRAMVQNDKEGSEFYLRLNTNHLNSAYVNCFEKEPSSTFHHKKLTVDYIFCTQRIQVISCQEIDTHSDKYRKRKWYATTTVCPTAKHPSDHVIIGASLAIPMKHRRSEACEKQCYKKCYRRSRTKAVYCRDLSANQ